MRKTAEVDPWLFFACLNAPIVKRQIKAKQFTQDIIDTLGKRLMELVLPIPQSDETRKRIAKETQYIIETRVHLRDRAREIAWEVEGIEHPQDEDLEVIQEI